MAETVLNTLAGQLVDLTLCKTRFDEWDLQWYTEGPFWRRTSMRFSREYKIIPDYEIADAKHGKTAQNILDESEYLMESLRCYKKTASQSEMARVEYLLEHVGHLNVRVRMLMGEKMPFDQMTEGLYSLVAPAYDYKKFDDILGELNQALPGAKSLSAREKIYSFQEKLRIPTDKLLKVLRDTTQVFHDISMKKMTLTGNSMPRIRVRELSDPSMVFLSILFGYDYNHIEYERNFNSLYPWTVDKIMEYIGHEMEPGHLTYFEKRLQTMIDTCWPEMSIVSLFSSSNAFSEGSSRHASSMCFDNYMERQVDFEREYIFKNAGLDTELATLMPLWHEYCEIVDYAKLEVTRNVWDGLWSREEAGEFLEKYAVASENKGLALVDELMASDEGHFVAHAYARDIVRSYFAATTKNMDEQWRLYEKLCSSHMSMSGMKDLSYKIEF